jgi:CheY-like chemotaxis protein
MEVSLPKGVQLKLVLHPSLPTVWADKTQVDQILLNLVTNAAQAMAQKSGEVKVSTQVVALPPEFCAQYRYHPSLEPGPYAMLEVQDQGTGIADDLQEKIFEPFVSEKGEGHGLGLATVFSIVHNHNGALEVESQEGQGSTFRVYLPLQPEEVGQSAGAKPQAPEVEASAPRTEPAPPTTEQVAPPREVEGGADKATGRGLVLCADDEPALLRLEKIVLERVGFEVITALDGQELLAAFQEHHDRLVGVVMDVTMPIHDGIQCKKEIRLVEPELPIVLTSGYMDSELVDEFQDDPHCSFLQKPWGPEKLLLALRIFVPRP